MTRQYPKRSELRRAEARASASTRRDDRRPAGGRPPGAAGRHGPPGPAAAQRVHEPARRSGLHLSGPPRMPIAVLPSAAVLPIRQTSDQTRPAGIALPIAPRPAVDAFHQPEPIAPMVPIAVPWATATAAPWTARRRRKVGGVRLLVLALVVGAEGLSVTALGGNPSAMRIDTSSTGVHAALQFSEASLQSAALQQLDVRQQHAAAIDQARGQRVAQAQAATAKAVAAVEQARAAALRARAAIARRDRAMRNAQRDPQSVAKLLMADRGWGAGQFSCLVSLWNRESRWNYRAYNPSSGAYGIPQALPGGKMASAGSDWRTNPVTQIRWGLSYIAGRYGSPCGAWGHSEAHGWY